MKVKKQQWSNPQAAINNGQSKQQQLAWHGYHLSGWIPKSGPALSPTKVVSQTISLGESECVMSYRQTSGSSSQRFCSEKPVPINKKSYSRIFSIKVMLERAESTMPHLSLGTCPWDDLPHPPGWWRWHFPNLAGQTMGLSGHWTWAKQYTRQPQELCQIIRSWESHELRSALSN